MKENVPVVEEVLPVSKHKQWMKEHPLLTSGIHTTVAVFIYELVRQKVFPESTILDNTHLVAMTVWLNTYFRIKKG